MDLPGKATHLDTRTHNERLVFVAIYDRGPISRAAVARATGLTRTSVSDIVTRLISSDLVHEVGKGPSTGGKAPILLETPDNARHLIGIDLGELAFRGAIVNLRGEILRSVELPVEDRRGDEALEQVFCLVDRLLRDPTHPIVGIGIGTPGLADATTGTVVESVNLGWRNLPLSKLLTDRVGLPVYVANDSQATALAEWAFGPRTSPNLVGVRIGRGVGAGVVLEGRLLQGDGFGAGEVGHTVVVEHGAPCRCGNRGCLETVASSRAILERIAEHQPGARPAPTIEEAVAAFRRDEEPTRSIVLEAARYLGLAAAGLVGTLNIRHIVLVGSVTAFGDPWLQVVRDTMRARALPVLAAGTSVDIGRLGDGAVVLGASALLLAQELGLFLASRRLPALPGAAVPAPEEERPERGAPGGGGVGVREKAGVGGRG